MYQSRGDRNIDREEIHLIFKLDLTNGILNTNYFTQDWWKTSDPKNYQPQS